MFDDRSIDPVGLFGLVKGVEHCYHDNCNDGRFPWQRSGRVRGRGRGRGRGPAPVVPSSFVSVYRHSQPFSLRSASTGLN